MKKYVCLMADFCSSGVWNEDGVSMCISEVPMHFWLKQMIDDWQAWYDREAGSTDFDVTTFSKHGYALAVKLKQNLPDWTVVYFDEAAFLRDLAERPPRSEHVKEITL
jgi:hypothetical protein